MQVGNDLLDELDFITDYTYDYDPIPPSPQLVDQIDIRTPEAENSDTSDTLPAPEFPAPSYEPIVEERSDDLVPNSEPPINVINSPPLDLIFPQPEQELEDSVPPAPVREPVKSKGNGMKVQFRIVLTRFTIEQFESIGKLMIYEAVQDTIKELGKCWM